MIFALAFNVQPASAVGADFHDLVASKNGIGLDGDANGDYVVDDADIRTIGRLYGTEIDLEDMPVDMNSDGVIDVRDLAETGMNYGSMLFEAAEPSGNTVYLSVEPVYTRVEPGDVFDVYITIDTDDEVFAASTIVTYNATILNATNASEGGFLGGDGESTFPIISIDHGNGTLFYDSTRFGTNLGINGTGDLLVITFKALGEGTTPVTIDDYEFVDESLLVITDVYTYNGTAEVNMNDAPVISPITDQSVDEAALLSFNVTVTDNDGDNVSLSVDSGPGSMAGNIYSYTSGWDTDHNDVVYNVTIRADDGYGGNDTESFQLTVNDVNRDPVIDTISNQNVDEGQTLSFTVSGSDPENDTLSYTVTSGPGSMAGSTYSYTPGWDANHADEVSAVTIEATDGQGGSDTESFQVTVNDVNRAPNISSYLPTDTTPAMDEGESLPFSITASDPDGDSLSYSWELDSIEVSTNPGYTYTTDFSSSGIHTVLVTVSDGNGGTDTQSWTVTVNDVPIACTQNSDCGTDGYVSGLFCSGLDVVRTYRTYTCNNPGTPQASCSSSDVDNTIETCGYMCSGGSCITNVAPTIDTFSPATNPTMDEDGSQDFTITASDLYGDTLTTTWKLDGTNVNNGNSYTYSPGYSDSGTHTVLVTVSDGELTDTHEWTVTVNNVNRAPSISSYSPTDTTPSVNEGSGLPFSVTASDPDGDTLSYAWKIDGTQVSTSSSFTYSPGYSDSGPHTVKVTVSDGKEGTDTQTWTATVNNVPMPDLIVEDVVIQFPAPPADLVHGQNILLGFTVKNVGEATANNVMWMIDTGSGDSNPERTVPITLSPGDGDRAFLFVNYASPGTYTATVISDHDDLVSESNEGNNGATIELEVI